MLRFFLYCSVILAVVFIPFKVNSNEEENIKIYKNSALRVSLSEVQKLKEKPKPKLKKIKPKPRPKPKPKPKKIIKKKTVTKKITEPIIEPPKKQEEPKEQVISHTVSNNSIRQSKLQSIKENYYSVIYAQIDAKKRYPKKALRFKQEGEVSVSFHVLRDGSITHFKLIKKSEFEALNKEIKRIFKSLRRFDKPPNEIEIPLEVHLSIRFKIDKE